MSTLQRRHVAAPTRAHAVAEAGLSYFGFLGLFLVPPLAMVAVRLGRAGLRRVARAAWPIAAIAVAYTTPWDHWILSQGVWSYPPGRVAGLGVGLVPIEEITFMVSQVALVCGVLALLRRRVRSGER